VSELLDNTGVKINITLFFMVVKEMKIDPGQSILFKLLPLIPLHKNRITAVA
jgi:hypothetical protein